MGVTYRYKNLDSLADHFWNKALDRRADAAAAKGVVQRELIAEACVYESVVFMLRATKLGDES